MRQATCVAALAATVLILAAGPALAQEASDQARPVAEERREFSLLDIPGNILRGALNIVTSPAEIVRSCTYEGSIDRRWTAYVRGTVYGVGYMVGRMFLGAVDICTLGLTHDHLYDDRYFPEYVWDAPWSADYEEPPTDY
jgi:hypothetical protein